MPVNASELVHGLYVPATTNAKNNLMKVFADIDRQLTEQNWDKVQYACISVNDTYKPWMFSHIKDSYERKGWIVRHYDKNSFRTPIAIWTKEKYEEMEANNKKFAEAGGKVGDLDERLMQILGIFILTTEALPP